VRETGRLPFPPEYGAWTLGIWDALQFSPLSAYRASRLQFHSIHVRTTFTIANLTSRALYLHLTHVTFVV